MILAIVSVLIACCQGCFLLPDGCTCTHDKQGELTVDCTNGNLTSVPVGIPARVVTLILHQNNISYIPNNTFEELSLLSYLDLSYNRIGKLEVDVFVGLKSLRILNLSRNRLAMNNNTFPENVFKDLKKLKILRINNNTVDISKSTGYPDEALSHVASLEKLQMDGLPFRSLGIGFNRLTNLRLLDFSGYNGFCDISNITEHMFSNVVTRNGLTLNMSQCNVFHIHPFAFSYLPTLEVLDFEDNGHLRFENFMIGSQSLQNTSLKVLNITTINRGEFMTLQGRYFQYLRKTSLAVIIVKHNGIICVDTLAINYLPFTLEYLSLRFNYILTADFLQALLIKPNIKTFDFGKQLYFTAKYSKRGPSPNPKASVSFCDKVRSQQLDLKFKQLETKHDYTTSKDDLNVEYLKLNESTSGRSDPSQSSAAGRNRFRKGSASEISTAFMTSGTPADDNSTLSENFKDHLSKVSCNVDNKLISVSDIPYPIPIPHSLENLITDLIRLGYAVPLINFTSYNNLHLWNLSSCLLYCFGGPIYGLRQLRVFDLSSNRCNDINPFFFSDMPRLTHLYLHDNNLGEALSYDQEGQTFSSQTLLKFLGLSKNAVRSLPEKIFKGLINLEHLVLSDNSIYSIQARIGHMKQLKILDLSGNELIALDRNNRQDLDQISKFTSIVVDITRNDNLRCTCDTIEFVLWLTETEVTIKNMNTTTCLLQDNSVVTLSQLKDLVSTLWMQCNNQNIFLAVLLVFVGLVMGLAVSGAVYYKRWKLRYLYYIGKRRVNPFNSLGPPVPVEHMLDVFISYDEDDRKWRTFVQDELLVRLEDNGISCLVSETHFLSGRPMREIIEEAVLGTKKTLALLTNEFFKSRDRELEFNMAVLHGMETRQDIVIPVAMETLEAENIPPDVKSFLKAYSPLIFIEGDEAFWTELVTKIRTAVQ